MSLTMSKSEVLLEQPYVCDSSSPIDIIPVYKFVFVWIWPSFRYQLLFFLPTAPSVHNYNVRSLFCQQICILCQKIKPNNENIYKGDAFNSLVLVYFMENDFHFTALVSELWVSFIFRVFSVDVDGFCAAESQSAGVGGASGRPQRDEKGSGPSEKLLTFYSELTLFVRMFCLRILGKKS